MKRKRQGKTNHQADAVETSDKAVPGFFREICYRKRHGLGGGGYSWAGFQLAARSAVLLAPKNSLEDVRAKLRELKRLIEYRKGGEVLKWFRAEFPGCLKLIKGAGLDRFLEGVDWANDENQIGNQDPVK